MGSAESSGVIVVGSINEDVTLQLGRRIRPGETVTARRVERRPGGKGANQAVAAAAGAAVAILGAIGDDPAGARMLEDLRRHGVNTESVRTVDGVSTGTAYVTVTPDGENTIVLDPGANEFVDAAAVEAAWPALPPASVLLSLLEIPLAGVTTAVRLAAKTGMRPVVTLAPAQPVPGELLSGLDPLLVNEHEAAFLLGADDLDGQFLDAAAELLRLGPRSAVITAGAAGAAVAVADTAGRTGRAEGADGGTVRLLPAVPVAEVLDTTGAGDAFAGALAAALARGADLHTAVAAGLRAGAEAVQRLGAR